MPTTPSYTAWHTAPMGHAWPRPAKTVRSESGIPGRANYGRRSAGRFRGCTARCSVPTAAISPLWVTISVRLGNPAGRVAVFDAETGREERSLSLELGNYGDLAYSPDGRILAVASGEGRTTSLVTVVDVATGNRRFTMTRSGEGIVGVAFAPDGRRIAVAVGSLDLNTISKRPGEILILDAATGGLVATLTGHTGPLTSVTYSADGTRLASVSMDHTARVYDVASGRMIQTLRGHTQMVNEVVFHPDDSNRLATASDDNSIRVWDVTSGQELFTLRGHTREIYGLAFRPDGRRLASASLDGTIKVWEVTPKESLTIPGFPSRGHRRGVSSRGEQACGGFPRRHRPGLRCELWSGGRDDRLARPANLGRRLQSRRPPAGSVRWRLAAAGLARRSAGVGPADGKGPLYLARAPWPGLEGGLQS